VKKMLSETEMNGGRCSGRHRDKRREKISRHRDNGGQKFGQTYLERQPPMFADVSLSETNEWMVKCNI